jgi:hypothetical protein
MTRVVRRFQGTYECGCVADPLEGPEFCVIHNVPKFYIDEPAETQVEVVEIPEATAQEIWNK